jgi:hypothetical protein
MAQLYLPVTHTEADLVLAGQIAELIDSAELYVAWTPQHGRAVPEVMAELRAAVPRWTDTLALLVEAARELWSLLRGRDPRVAAPAPTARAGGEQPAQPKPAAGEAAA